MKLGQLIEYKHKFLIFSSKIMPKIRQGTSSRPLYFLKKLNMR